MGWSFEKLLQYFEYFAKKPDAWGNIEGLHLYEIPRIGEFIETKNVDGWFPKAGKRRKQGKNEMDVGFILSQKCLGTRYR